MGFWIFTLMINMMTPLTMIGFGKWFSNNAPREIQMAFGYRTAMSTKNRETWQFAHAYIGNLWWICGWIALPLTVVLMLFVLGKDEDIVGNWGGMIILIQAFFLVGTIFPTERALRKNFDKEGRRRQ